MKLPLFRPCSKCADGYIYDDDKNEAKKCKCLTEHQKKVKLLLDLENANIPPNENVITYDIDRNYIGQDEQNNIEKLKYFIDHFREKFYDKVLYLYGNRGTQKTTISYWIGKKLLQKDISVYFVLMNDLIKELQEENFNDNIDTSKYFNCDCLIIDRAFIKDQVTIYKSGYQLPFLDNFLRKRIDVLQKSIIFISNAVYYNIVEHGFNEDIGDLVRRKVEPYKNDFYFNDHFSIKDNFNYLNLWGYDGE